MIRRFQQLEEKFYFWLAWKIPRKLAYYATVRLGAHATQGKYGSQIVSELTVLESMDRWDD